jgi:hypothetical protein
MLFHNSVRLIGRVAGAPQYVSGRDGEPGHFVLYVDALTRERRQGGATCFVADRIGLTIRGAALGISAGSLKQGTHVAVDGRLECRGPAPIPTVVATRIEVIRAGSRQDALLAARMRDERTRRLTRGTVEDGAQPS